MQNRHREQEGGDQAGRLIGDTAAELEQHDDRQRAAECDEGAGDQEIFRVADLGFDRQHRSNPGHDPEDAGERVERQRWPVKEPRVEVAASGWPTDVAERGLFVRTGAAVGQAEPNREQPQRSTNEDDGRQPELRRPSRFHSQSLVLSPRCCGRAAARPTIASSGMRLAPIRIGSNEYRSATTPVAYVAAIVPMPAAVPLETAHRGDRSRRDRGPPAGSGSSSTAPHTRRSRRRSRRRAHGSDVDVNRPESA